jgi:4-hydroxy-tetrahydrodipicolinate synthase
MRHFPNYQPAGVIPATLLALNDDFSINEAETRRHLSHVAQTRGLSSITVNGHASEILSCPFDEQKRILELSLDEVGDKIPLVNGVFASGSLEAARVARMADQAGASCLLVAPPEGIGLGGQMRPEMALTHFRHIADATDLPIILFQYPMTGSGLGYPFETMLRLFEEIPSIRAIKDWSNDAMLHERQTRELQALAKPVTVLTTHSAWLMSSLTMGAGGLLSGSGSVIPDLQVELFEAVQAKDLARAQKINDRIYPLAQAFYAPPLVDMHNRMKECLKILGRLDKAVVRPPLYKLPDAEIARLAKALKQAGIERDGALPIAA